MGWVEALRHTVEEYKRLNLGTDDIYEHIHDMQTLIKRKLQLFPDVKKVIVNQGDATDHVMVKGNEDDFFAIRQI